MLLAHHYPRRWLARYRRQRGRYDHLTLGLYCRLWYATRQPADLLAWLRFRRDLGYGLPLRLRRALWQALPGLDGTRFWQGVALWLESGGDAARLAGLLVQQGRGGRDALAMLQNPLVLQGLVSQGMELPDADQQKLASLVRSQVAWQQAFRQALQQARAEGGVCVVGNAAGLRGSGLGARIDAHAWVMRFNCFQGETVAVPDVGTRLQAQVLTAGSEPCAGPQGWLLLSGPQVLAMRQDWRAMLPLCQAERKMLSVPLPVWRMLVRVLKAPPSAGMLVLAWLRQLLGGWQGIRVAGFGGLLPAATGAAYHLARPGHRAAARHNWQGERVLLQQWRAQGLVSLHE